MTITSENEGNSAPTGVTRLAMVLPGAVSLGAYEAGALAALLTAVQAAQGELVIDAISSASAGSITALIASRALLSGANPVKLMTQTWVDLPSLDHLKTHHTTAPLTMQKLSDAATRLLGPSVVPDGAIGIYRQDVPIRLSMALTALGGLNFRMARLRDTDEGRKALVLLGQSCLDWFNVTLPVDADEKAYLAVVEGALASGSTPVGFPPRLLDRGDADVVEAYTKAGIVNPTNDWHIWYSDGGDIDNEPFGRVLDLIEAPGGDESDDRVIVLLQTEPPKPTWDGPWFDPDPSHVPTWTSTLFRVNHIRSSQSYYQDLVRLEKTNARLEWTETVAAFITKGLDEGLAGLPEADQARVRDRLAQAFADADGAVTADQALLDEARSPGGTPRSAPADAPTLLSVFQRAAGLEGKRPVLVEIISPAIDDPRPAAEQLAGEFLYHFGGFFDIEFRKSDFALGYRNAMTWLWQWLPTRVSNPGHVVSAVGSAYDALGWDGIREGQASVSSLSLKEDLQAIGLLTHIARVFEYGLRHDAHVP
jgi:predicted acylesterase/phospholipase RssA